MLGSDGRDHKGRPNFFSISALLEITTKDEKPWINLEKAWFPTDRIGNLFGDEIQVKIRDRIFSSKIPIIEKKSDVFFGVDADLLCRYLFGKAHATDVFHAVLEPRLEETAQVRCGRLELEKKQVQQLYKEEWAEKTTHIRAFDMVSEYRLILETLKRVKEKLKGNWLLRKLFGRLTAEIDETLSTR